MTFAPPCSSLRASRRGYRVAGDVLCRYAGDNEVIPITFSSNSATIFETKSARSDESFYPTFCFDAMHKHLSSVTFYLVVGVGAGTFVLKSRLDVAHSFVQSRGRLAEEPDYIGPLSHA